MQLHQFSCPKGWSVEVVWVPAPRINRNHPGHYLQLGYHLLGVAASATAWITTRWHKNQLTWSPYVTTPSHAVYRSPGEWRNMEKPSLKSFGAMDVAHEHHTAWQRMFHLDAPSSIHTVTPHRSLLQRPGSIWVSRASPTASRGAWVPFFRGHEKWQVWCDRKPKVWSCIPNLSGSAS